MSSPKSLSNSQASQVSTDPESVLDLTKRNVELIAELEASAKSERTKVDRFVDAITGFVGRIAFVWIHLVWFTVWIVLNLTHVAHFDPYPFNLLSLIVSLEAIFLATFILISQNRQARVNERRSHLDLQINLLSEQENTKIIAMLVAIMQKLDIEDEEADTAIMLESTEPSAMVAQIQEIIEREETLEREENELDDMHKIE